MSDPTVYGIIDPDYARVFTQARIVAWQYGYACVMHGSFTRDLDLLLVPWTDKAVANGDQLMRLIAQGCGLRFRGGKEDINTAHVDWSEKPHGRKACSLFFQEFGDRRWIDISIFEPTIAQLERENEAPYRPMRTAPKNGHAVLALVEGSDIPRAIRWLASDDPRALSGAGWYMTWDDTFVDPAIDGPRYWMPIADDPDAIDNGTYNPKIGGEE